MKKILLVSHDAGGAEVLSSWLLHNESKYYVIAKGPAKAIFQKKKLVISDLSLEEAIKKVDYVITGTSWQSQIEKETLFLCKRFGKYAITMLDHWGDYRERFLYKGILILPNEIWVLDYHAYDIAKKLFKGAIIKIKENYYFNEIAKKIEKKGTCRENNKKIGLFIGENISEHSSKIYKTKNHFGYDENDALNFLIENIPKIDLDIQEVRIRPHPSESGRKYNWALSHNLISKISEERELLDDILDADIIFGCESMALVVALKIGKKVISCIPNNEINCSLPFKEIIHLRDLINSNNK